MPLDARRELARDAFAATAAYESAIATWFGETESFPDQLTLTFRKAMDLSYGENPHQAAAFYREDGTRRHLLSHVDQLGGKELSYNNLVDLEGGRRLLREFALPAVVIVKHANPCGVAVAGTIEEAWERALAADPVSAFGCVALLNRPVFAELGARIAGHFVEVLMAPGYDDAATDVLRAKQALRLLWSHDRRGETPGERDYKRVLGGLLVQDRDVEIEDRAAMKVVCGELTEAQWGDLLFAWRVCKHVSSNAIVIARDLQTIGIGAGPDEPRRLGADRDREGPRARPRPGRLRCSRATRSSRSPTGRSSRSTRASSALIQPGGSRRDNDVIDVVNERRMRRWCSPATGTSGTDARAGVDLGGTKIEVLIVEGEREVLGRARRPTPTEGGAPRDRHRDRRRRRRGARPTPARRR